MRSESGPTNWWMRRRRSTLLEMLMWRGWDCFRSFFLRTMCLRPSSDRFCTLVGSAVTIYRSAETNSRSMCKRDSGLAGFWTNCDGWSFQWNLGLLRRRTWCAARLVWPNAGSRVENRPDLQVCIHLDPLFVFTYAFSIFHSRQPQGHLLLIGTSGSGKTTMSRFVGEFVGSYIEEKQRQIINYIRKCLLAWLNGLSVFQLKVHSKYTAADFDEDMRHVSFVFLFL